MDVIVVAMELKLKVELDIGIKTKIGIEQLRYTILNIAVSSLCNFFEGKARMMCVIDIGVSVGLLTVIVTVPRIDFLGAIFWIRISLEYLSNTVRTYVLFCLVQEILSSTHIIMNYK